MKNIKIIVGDITKQKVDVIVNAANSVGFLLIEPPLPLPKRMAYVA